MPKCNFEQYVSSEMLIIIPMKVKISNPAAIFLFPKYRENLVLIDQAHFCPRFLNPLAGTEYSPTVAVSIHFAANNERGVSNTMKDAICIQANGIEIEVPGTVTKKLVKGSTKNIASKAALIATTGNHLRLIKKPVAKTAIKSGTKSPTPKSVGKFMARPNPIAPKLPINTVSPPM